MGQPPTPTGKSRASGALIQIASIPRQFYIDSFGSLSEFFLPLLDLAREAALSQRSVESKDKTAAYNAASHLAGELLREGNCLIGREFLNVANSYQIDFQSDQFVVAAQVFAVGGGTAASFFVKITSTIIGEVFRVIDPRTDRELFHFSESEARKPDFFSREFPFIAHKSRLNPTRYTTNINPSTGDALDIQLVVSVLGENKTIRIRKQIGDDRLDVFDVVQNARIAYFPASCLSDFPKLTQLIQEYMTMCAQGEAPEEPPTDAGKQLTRAPAK